MTAVDRQVSYAQHGEDVVLARALSSVSSGFYVDVGAGSPDRASVTRHFYEQGWTGIHIEPRPDLAEELRRARERDVVVEAAASDEDGVITLYVPAEDGDLATTKPDNAAHLEGQGLHVHPLEVAMRTLDGILEQVGPTEIDFLKIDVEGAEDAVLRGVDLSRWRPKILVVESTRPNTNVASYHGWEPIVTAHGYLFASTDGLNRFYVRPDLAAEMAERLFPANPTDSYVSAGVLLMEEEIERLRAYVRHVESELVAKTRPVDSLESRVRAPAPVHWVAPGSPSPLGPARLAVLGMPCTGNTWLAEMLAVAFSAERIVVQHPADLPWEELPDSLVLQLNWHPTEYLRRLLRIHHVSVVSMARHPLDVLLSVLGAAQREDNTDFWLADEGGDDSQLRNVGPNDAAFLAWAQRPRARALLSVTPEWWQDQGTIQVRHEELTASPFETLRMIATEALELSGCDVKESDLTARLEEAVEVKRSDPVNDAAPGVWQQVLLACSVEQIAAAHPNLWSELGYARPQGGLTDVLAARRAWQERL